MGAPFARWMPLVDEFHGRRVPDAYRWLEADDDPECAQWLAEQGRWYACHVAQWSSRAGFAELLRRHGAVCGASMATVSPPVWRGQLRFFLRRGVDQELPVLLVGTTGTGERVVVDPVALDPSGLTTLDAWRPSWSGELLAYQTSVRGSEIPTLRVLNVATGSQADGPLYPGRVTPVAWLPDDTGFYYVTWPSDGPRQVRRHLLGEHPDDDVVIFSTTFRQVSVSISPNGQWLMVSCAPGAQRGNMVYLADLTARLSQIPELRLLYNGTSSDAQALLKFGPRNLLYAITTDQAPGGRVCTIDPATPSAQNWRPVITVGHGEVLSGCVALIESTTKDIRFLASSAKAGTSRLSLHDVNGGLLAHVPAPRRGPGTIMKLTAPPGQDTRAWFAYTDFLTPSTIYRFSLTDRQAYPEIPSEHGEQPITQPSVRQVSYPSEDGSSVPMFLVLPPGDRQGPRPTIMIAYGGFGATAAPAYSPTILSWVSAGGIYAIAGVRGGGECGKSWHAAGSGANKPNAFADFAAAARWLTTHGFTTPDQLAIKGNSHSGLMVAVAITRNPELYAAAVCSGALTDMIRYPHFGLGQWWIDEFGDPQNPEHLDTLLSYSPYHRVTPGTAYPAILLTSARRDARVGAAHTRKFTAALQHATTSDKPILLRTEDGVGHGPCAASRTINAEADALAFCATHTGLALKPDSLASAAAGNSSTVQF